MSVNQINPVDSSAPSQPLTVSNSPTREVSDAEASSFAELVKVGKTNTNSSSMAEVTEAIHKGILFNAINDNARMRQELKEIIEDQG